MNPKTSHAEPLTSEGQLAIRTRSASPDHHLWNNRGTWWCHFTLHQPNYTSRRVRCSLRTKDLDQARERRDRLFRALQGPTPTAHPAKSSERRLSS